MRNSLLMLMLCSAAMVFGCGEKKNDAVAASPDTHVAASASTGVYGSVVVKPPPAELARLGKQLFFDASLSASGRMSCASCHDPQHAYGPPNALSVQPGGRDLQTSGLRAAPSLRYLQQLPAFTEHFYENDGDDSKDQGPTGGHNWDGRVDSAHGQAEGPLLSQHEMGNADRRAVVEKLRASAHADEFRRMFGDMIFDQTDQAFLAATMALEVFQQTPTEFYPYTSRYDAYLRGQTKLSRQEMRGLALFDDPDKGNCASCHQDKVASSGFPALTDFGYIALAAPRNKTLPANADDAYFDLGLCGPQRTDLAARTEYCGLFRTPSLRNVAIRQSFFHNGVFHSLREVLQFYAQRDSHPQKWYAQHTVHGEKPQQYDDLPAQYHANVYRDAPFDRQQPGKSALSAAEMDDIIAFLKTLTDADLLTATAPAGQLHSSMTTNH